MLAYWDGPTGADYIETTGYSTGGSFFETAHRYVTNTATQWFVHFPDVPKSWRWFDRFRTYAAAGRKLSAQLFSAPHLRAKKLTRLIVMVPHRLRCRRKRLFFLRGLVK
jgi:hypothetical protein